MYYKLDENGYLCACSFDTVLPGGELYRGRVPEDFDEENFDCWKIEEDTLTFDENRQRAIGEEAADIEELAELLDWFDQYDRQVMEYQRCSRLGQAYDRDINQLDQEAIEKQQRVRVLRERSGINVDK